jgi:hypothetical protein
VTLGGATLGSTNQLMDSNLTAQATTDTLSLGISLPNVTAPLTIACTGTGTCTPSTSTLGSNIGTISLTVSPGTYTLTINATAFTASLAVYGPLTVSQTTLNFSAISPNSGSTAALTIFQPGPTGSNMTIAWACNNNASSANGALIGLSGTFSLASANSATINEPFGTNYAETVTAYQAPTSGTNPTACTISATGGAAQTGSVSVNIFPTSINVTGERRGVSSPPNAPRRPQ